MSQEDNEDYIHCPYDVSHYILKVRMPKHLVKCRLQHKTTNFKTCPYNTTHDVPAAEFEYHAMTCPDKKKLENYVYVIGDSREDHVPAHVDVPSSSENWDEDEVPVKSYLHIKDKNLEDKMVFRTPVGLSKRERKDFTKNEVLRLERVRCSQNDTNKALSASIECKKKKPEMTTTVY